MYDLSLTVAMMEVSNKTRKQTRVTQATTRTNGSPSRYWGSLVVTAVIVASSCGSSPSVFSVTPRPSSAVSVTVSSEVSLAVEGRDTGNFSDGALCESIWMSCNPSCGWIKGSQLVEAIVPCLA